MKRAGFVLLEIVCAAVFVSFLLGLTVSRFGDVRRRLQEQQLHMAARRFIMECRRVQQYNMYATLENRMGITYDIGDNYFLIKEVGSAAKKYRFADYGCGDVFFASVSKFASASKTTSGEEIYFSPLGSVDESEYITLKHRDNPELKVILNLQPVTGRLEIDE